MSILLCFSNPDFGNVLDFLTLIVTVIIACIVYRYQEKRDKEIERQNEISTLFELYKHFTGDDFREKRFSAWNVLRRAIENPDYANFIVNETLTSRYENRESRKDVFTKFKSIYNDNVAYSQKDFLHKESEDRDKLEAVLNFFHLLAIRNFPEGTYKACDFYYDSWRPILYWYAKKLDECYNKNKLNQQFNNPPNLKETVKRLDKKFYFPKDKDSLTFGNIEEHPLIKYYIVEKKSASNGKKNP